MGKGLSLIESLARAAHDDVEAGGLLWRVRKVSTADLLAAGRAVLTVVPEANLDGDDDEVADAKTIAEIMLSKTDAEMNELYAHQAVVVAAGTIACSDDGGETWEPLVMTVSGGTVPEKQQLRVADLPYGVEPILFAAIMKLTMDREASKRIARFRSESNDGPDRRSNRKKAGKVGG